MERTAGATAQDQEAPRFPRFFRPRSKRILERFRGFHRVFPGEVFVGDALTENVGSGEMEAVAIFYGVGFVAAIVEAERLFVNVSEQMKRFDGDIGAMKTTLQKRPKVLHAI